jgi:YfiR/HmsC-like
MMNIRLRKGTYRASGWGGRFVVRIDSCRILRAFFFAIIAGGLFLSASPKALSQNEEGAEYSVKLGFLYNFTKFVEWPPDSFRDPGAPLVICIVGHDPFRQDLEAELQTRKVGDHPVEVRTQTPNDRLSVCHIVFVPVTEKSQSDRILRGLQGSRTLTVGETEGFAELGGIINLTVEDNKVHFEINRLAADRAGLKIRSWLLSIAKIVKEQDHGRKSWNPQASPRLLPPTALATSGMVPLHSLSKRSCTTFSKGSFGYTRAYDGLEPLMGRPA